LNSAMEKSNTTHLSEKDVMATLNELTLQTILLAMKQLGTDIDLYNIFISGGGIKNRFLIDRLKSTMTDYYIDSTNALGIDPDAKEAILFAVLANECVSGELKSFPKINGMPLTSMGKVCFPA